MNEKIRPSFYQTRALKIKNKLMSPIFGNFFVKMSFKCYELNDILLL